MEMNQQYMQRMMDQMDSLKNQYFQRPGTPLGPGGDANQPGGNMQPSGVQRTQPGSERERESTRRGQRETTEM